MGLENVTMEQAAAMVAQSANAKNNILCEEHGFFPGKPSLMSNPPVKGCKSCVMAVMMWDFATTPPHLQAERVAQLESLTHNLIHESETNPNFNPDAFFDDIHIDIEHEDEPESN